MVEEKIPLAGAKTLSERTYFIYYPQTDILVLSLNHLGPRHSDLAFLLSTPVIAESLFLLKPFGKKKASKNYSKLDPI